MAVLKYPVNNHDFEEYSNAPEAKAAVYEPNYNVKKGDTLIIYEQEGRVVLSNKRDSTTKKETETFFTGREKRFTITEVEKREKNVQIITFQPQ